MENRERDRVSQRTTPTKAGELNRHVEEERGREVNSGTSAEFGQKIGRAENLSEGGEMRNKDNERNMNKNIGMGNEQSRRPSEEFDSSSGSMDRNQGSTNISRDDKSPGRGGTGTLGSTGSSEGRH
jgi:hypothetical protein